MICSPLCPMNMFSWLCFSCRHVIFSRVQWAVQVHSCMTDQIKKWTGQVFTWCRSAVHLNFFFHLTKVKTELCVERKCRRCRTVSKCSTYVTDSFYCIISNTLLFYYKQPKGCEKTSSRYFNNITIALRRAEIVYQANISKISSKYQQSFH